MTSGNYGIPIREVGGITSAHADVCVVLISVDALEGLGPAFEASGAAGFVRKQDLRPRVLLELWQARCRNS